MSSEVTGIGVTNQVNQTKEVNALIYEGLLQGAGIGVLDYDNDGLKDLYFATNQGNDKLFKNLGSLRFKEVTNEVGIQSKAWSTGVSIVDINSDGLDDIYVSKYVYDDPQLRENQLFVNDGKGKFSEQAKAYGINDTGYSIMANFFDYDRDGDLDLYVANQPPNSLSGKENQSKNKAIYTDNLYRNDGKKFTKVTAASGITNYCYSLSATIIDINNDGWQDIYVTSDYDEPDILYQNNGNGTFTSVANEALKHMSNFSMGADVADINNDGHQDLFVADMVAEDNYRQKTNMSGMNPEKFYALANAGYHHQYMFNTMQLNNGDNTFSEIAQLSGISNSDWSWAPLFIDLDNDSNKDLIITNGLIIELRNKDFEKKRDEYFKEKFIEAQAAGGNISVNPLEVLDLAPAVKIQNYIYKNNGDLSFSKMSDQWGFDNKTWSQGAVYADLDNDNDLDLIIGNVNSDVDIYENKSADNNIGNFINIVLEGSPKNPSGIGSMVTISYDGKKQSQRYTPYRGYMSTVDRIVHFGIGQNKALDNVEIEWPDGMVSNLTNVDANQTLKVNYKSAKKRSESSDSKKVVFTPESVPVKHAENNYNDFQKEVLLPYKLSTLGPILVKGDINGNGLEEVFMGSSTGYPSSIGSISSKGIHAINTPSISKDRKHEDGGAAFFDADGDNDLDLYVSSGGNEHPIGSDSYQDRLYLNDGNGNYAKASNRIPDMTGSNSVVLPIDYDDDGDSDLFIGGRQVPGQYGKPTNSTILRNDSGKFTDVTQNLIPSFNTLGMVTDAAYVDLDQDGNKELVICGEWMPIKVYDVSNNFKDISSNFGFSQTNGWWNTMNIDDIDSDGDLDILAGNLGLNIKYKASKETPFTLYVDDFDDNGTNDVYLGFYENGQCFPVRGRQCSSEQMPFVKDEFATYAEFGAATIDQVLSSRISTTTVKNEVHTFANTLFKNNNGQFEAVALPNEAQLAPIYGIVVDDFDKDGKKEAFLAGNMYNREVETTRSDAGKGCFLEINNDGSLSIERTERTGISADKDVRDVAIIKSDNSKYLIIANNNDVAQVYKY